MLKKQTRSNPFVEMLTASSSRDPAIRQQAFNRFENLVAKADQLPADKRLTYLERSALAASFATWGLGVDPELQHARDVQSARSARAVYTHAAIRRR